ncbi:hypothetical protein CYMTET_25630 [Cymbomonas tetramitiformis]|uniref:VPS9 domain-containing protein n=1 Tax=Cymbomonas tetramitiformis TaxID=36881 RepID=A0AAE0KYR5_9CHLO|nr:hypothetical protein CYMTET_25630 [Cymbomonas tetramitiformis]
MWQAACLRDTVQLIFDAIQRLYEKQGGKKLGGKEEWEEKGTDPLGITCDRDIPVRPPEQAVRKGSQVRKTEQIEKEGNLLGLDFGPHAATSEGKDGSDSDNEPMSEEAALPCADDLLSLVVLLITRANVHHLVANATYMDNFLSLRVPFSHKGELGYVLANFMAAVEYIKSDDLLERMREAGAPDPAPRERGLAKPSAASGEVLSVPTPAALRRSSVESSAGGSVKDPLRAWDDWGRAISRRRSSLQLWEPPQRPPAEARVVSVLSPYGVNLAVGCAGRSSSLFLDDDEAAAAVQNLNSSLHVNTRRGSQRRDSFGSPRGTPASFSGAPDSQRSSVDVGRSERASSTSFYPSTCHTGTVGAEDLFESATPGTPTSRLRLLGLNDSGNAGSATARDATGRDAFQTTLLKWEQMAHGNSSSSLDDTSLLRWGASPQRQSRPVEIPSWATPRGQQTHSSTQGGLFGRGNVPLAHSCGAVEDDRREEQGSSFFLGLNERRGSASSADESGSQGVSSPISSLNMRENSLFYDEEPQIDRLFAEDLPSGGRLSTEETR